jgi:hypothetical protein
MKNPPFGGIDAIEKTHYLCRVNFYKAKIMANGKLDKSINDKLSFIAFIIPEFALAYKMTIQNAYLYLKQYGGLDYLNRHWWALHTEDPYWSLKSLYATCYKNGGLR